MAAPGRMNGDGLSLHPDFPGVGLIQAVEDAHQRAFARAIFTQQGMDFALLQGEIHLVVGGQIAKALDDAAHFHGQGLIGHGGWERLGAVSGVTRNQVIRCPANQS